MFQHIKHQAGMTLLEILMVMTILSVVMIAMFQVLDVNYATMHTALDNQETRDNLRFFNSYVMQDIADSEFISIQNEATFDVLVYTDYQGYSRVVKFAHQEGVYEVKNAEEVLIAKAVLFDSGKPMVYEENGLIYFNVYAKDVNVLMDLAIEPRVRE